LYLYFLRNLLGSFIRCDLKIMPNDVRSIHDFQIISMLGKGAMGDVWHAYRYDTSETYAIKSIKKTPFTDIERVAREREILASVNNPFVVRMFWAFQDDSHVYFVLEHAKGGDLLSVVHRFYSDGMSEAYARFYIVEILLALEYLHEMNVIVCDLKPANCLTTAAGHIVLTDFSHSKWLLGPDDSQRRVSSSFVKSDSGLGSGDCRDTADCAGTAEYMAPEILQGQDRTKMVDYWCLGIMMYELIYARLPWGSCENIDIADLFYSIITQPVWFPAFEDGETSSNDEEITGGAEVQIEQPGKRSRPVSAAATGLMGALLDKEPSNRLGAVVAQIKTHEGPLRPSINSSLLSFTTGYHGIVADNSQLVNSFDWLC
jgi:serine/threonine protein kinase